MRIKIFSLRLATYHALVLSYSDDGSWLWLIIKILNIYKYILGSAPKNENNAAFHVRKTGPTQNNAVAVVVFEQVVTDYGGIWNNVSHHFIVLNKGNTDNFNVSIALA